MRHLVLLFAIIPAGCREAPTPSAGSHAAPPRHAAVPEADAICKGIAFAISNKHVTVSRKQLENLDALAKRHPRILASPSSAREARRIGGLGYGDWPVVENNGRWFVLETKRLVGKISDTMGNAPIIDPVQEPHRARPSDGSGRGDAE
jgi:hypothetical protein